MIIKYADGLIVEWSDTEINKINIFRKEKKACRKIERERNSMIRALYINGMTHAAIGKRYQMPINEIYRIVRGGRDNSRFWIRRNL